MDQTHHGLLCCQSSHFFEKLYLQLRGYFEILRTLFGIKTIGKNIGE